jgi:hypothetical protein
MPAWKAEVYNAEGELFADRAHAARHGQSAQ